MKVGRDWLRTVAFCKRGGRGRISRRRWTRGTRSIKTKKEKKGDDYDRGMEAYERELKDDETLSMHRGGRRDETIKFKEEGVEDIIEDDNDTFASQNGAVYLSLSTREVVNSSGVASPQISSPIRRNFTNHHADAKSIGSALDENRRA